MIFFLSDIVHACRRGPRLQAGVLGAATALAIAGCAGAAAPAENNRPSGSNLGTIGMALAGQSPSGAKYRLRNALIELDGPGPTSYVSTEDDPNRTQFSTDVDPGVYSISLNAGWHLERVYAGGSGDPVDAQLTSDNPQVVSVFLGSRTPVEFHFHVGGEDIELDKGGIDIGIDVDD